MGSFKKREEQELKRNKDLQDSAIATKLVTEKSLLRIPVKNQHLQVQNRQCTFSLIL